MNFRAFELAVDRRGVHGRVRDRRLQVRQAFGRGDDRQEPDPPGAEIGEALDGHRGRAAGRQHGVEQEDGRAGQVLRHLLVVPARHRRHLVALETEVADLRLRHQLEERVQHPEAGAQHRHRHHARRQAPHRRGLERGLDGGLGERPGLAWPPRPGAGSRGGRAGGRRRRACGDRGGPRERSPRAGGGRRARPWLGGRRARADDTRGAASPATSGVAERARASPRVADALEHRRADRPGGSLADRHGPPERPRRPPPHRPPIRAWTTARGRSGPDRVARPAHVGQADRGDRSVSPARRRPPPERHHREADRVARPPA